MELTIENLSHYLPYRLKFQHSAINMATISTMNTLDNTCVNSGNWHFDEIKPLLIPLYELSKQQVIDIFAAGFLSAGHTDWPIYNIDIEWHDKLAVELLYKKASFSFDFVNCQFETQSFAFNQKKSFEKIYELHGDINGLIEAGLAINKNHTQS